MNKRTIKLLALLAAFAVLLGGYGLISYFSGQDEDSQAAETVTVAAIEADSVSALSWTYEDESVSLRKESNGGWINTKDETMPVDVDMVEPMLSALSGISASRSLEDTEDLEAYGLDAPACTITVTETDGTALSFSIGDYNSVSDSYYLLYKDTIYLVDSTLLSAYSVTAQDLIAYETLPDMSDTLTITVSSGENTITLVHRTERMEDYTYTASYSWFLEQEDTYVPLSSSAVSSLKSTITGMEFLNCAAWDADKETMAEYGLSDPAGTVTVTYSEESAEDSEDASEETTLIEQSLTILIGSYTDEDSCYVMLEGSDMIYTIDAYDADELLLLSASSLLPDDICLVEQSTVDALEIKLDGETSTITMTHDTDDEGNTTSTCYYDDVELDPEAVEDVFSTLNGMDSVGTADSALGQRDVVLELVFHRNTETFSEMTLVFSTYDSSSYLVTFQGESRLLVDKSSVRDLMDLLETALSSEPQADEEEASTEESD